MTKLNNKSAFVNLSILLAIALVVRVVFVLATQHIGSPDSMDSGTYHNIAVNLLDGKGFSEDGENPSIFVAPLYPFLLFIFYKVFGVHPLIIEIFQCFLSVGTGLLVYLLTRKFFASTIAFLAATIALVVPDLIIITTFLYTETFFIFLFIALILTALFVLEKPRLKFIVLAGFVGGIVTLSRGVTLLFPFLLFMALLVKYDFLKSLKTVLLYSLFFVLPILPWTIRNYITHNQIIPIAVGTGDVLWTGNYLPFDGKYNYDSTMDLMDSMTVGLDQIERDAKLTKVAKENIIAEPYKSGWLVVKKFFRFWTWVYEDAPTGQKRTNATAIGTVLKIGYFPILLFFIYGLYLTRGRWKDLSLLYLVILYYSAIHAVLLVVPRYRIPILPLLAVFASVGIVDIFNKLRQKNFFSAVKQSV
jgi:4-amino-4-deoxy-L-arabinose transferase-like glycosyltransferase